MGTDEGDAEETIVDEWFGRASFIARERSGPVRNIAAAIASIPSLETDEVDERDLVRSFTLTGGRTRASSSVSFETMVISKGSDDQRYPPSSPKALILACVRSEPLSVAELSVHLRLPIGVVAVLVGDLIDRRDLIASGHPDGLVPTKNSRADLLKRVISRVEAL